MAEKSINKWQKVNFDSFFDVLPSKKYQVQRQDYLSNGDIPVVDQGQSLIAGYTNDKSKIFNHDKVIIFGDHTRIVKYIDFEFAVGADGTQILGVKQNINLKFAYYQLLNKKIPDTGYNRHFKYVKAEDYYIPPTLEEQQEIVDVLDAADRIISLRTACIESAQSIIPALFQEMFGDVKNNTKNWKLCNLNDLVYIDRKNISVNELKSNAYRYIGLEHIEKDTGKILIDLENNFNVDLKSNKYYFTNEHVLYGKLRPYLNKVALPTCDGVCSTDIFPIMPRKNISNKYFIKYLMSSPYFVQITSLKTSGANLPRIGTKVLELIKVICPDIEIQNQFAAKAQEIEAYIKTQQAELENAKTMFQSLLHHSFTGELTRRAYGE